MIFVLLFLMVILSAVTVDHQQLVGAAAGREVAQSINRIESPRNVLIATPQGKLDIELAQSIEQELAKRHTVIAVVQSGPTRGEFGTGEQAKSHQGHPIDCDCLHGGLGQVGSGLANSTAVKKSNRPATVGPIF